MSDTLNGVTSASDVLGGMQLPKPIAEAFIEEISRALRQTGLALLRRHECQTNYEMLNLALRAFKQAADCLQDEDSDAMIQYKILAVAEWSRTRTKVQLAENLKKQH